MTTNAMLGYFGVALAFFGAAFILLAISPPRGGWPRDVGGSVEALRNRAALVARRRANAYCAAILVAVAVIAEVVSILRGGPTAGELSGNASGGFLAISLATFFCLIGCLIVRRFILVHLRLRLEAQSGCRSECFKGK
jgi:hypothetical protein